MKKTIISSSSLKAALAILLVFTAQLVAFGQSIFTNPITDTNPSASSPYTTGQTVAGNMTASGIARGPGIQPNAGANRYNATSWSFPGFDANDYFTFTLTPNAGFGLNLVSFVYTGQVSSTGPVQYAFRSSLDGFASNIGAPGTSGSISLSASQFQGVSTAIEFRFYAWGGSAGAGTYSINDFTFNGTVTASGPIVNSPAVTNITDNSAKLSANLVSTGGTTILEKGFVWSTTTNPLVGGAGVTKVMLGNVATGAYDSTITGLPAGTRIFFKGYVKNSTNNYYTTEGSFFTLSAEPGAYPSTFTATAISKNSIKLDWTQVAGANGYIILQKLISYSTGTPTDATAYTVNQALGDGTVVAVIPAGSTITTTISGLIQGTRYYYTLFPFGYNGTTAATYNYRTLPTIPAANDSTWGFPPSRLSVVEGVVNSESIGIPTLVNDNITTATSGIQVWKLQVKDGGPTMNDPDDLPTIVTRIVINKGPKNKVTSWLNSLQSAGLIDDSTGAVLATGVITANNITFNTLNITAADNNYRPLTMRLTLKKIAHKDKDTFQFATDSASVQTKGLLESSQTKNFSTASDSVKNTINVIATKLRFVNNPAATVETGFALGQIQVEAVDTFNSRDLDFNGSVALNATGANLIAAPRTVTAVNGLALFDTVRFNKAILSDTLVATNSGLIEGRSTMFKVENSKLSDIISDGGFSYPQNILHVNYRDTNAITTANSLAVFNMLLRDGGAIDDNDFEPTVLTALTLNVTNSYLIKKAALYVGTTKVAQADSVTTSGSNKQLVFNGLNITANDNDSAAFSLRITFKDSAVDGDRLGFTVVSATNNATGSVFAAANAGGAASSSLANNNKIDVVARKLVFIQQPANVAVRSIQYPIVIVSALDSLNNIDLAGRTVTLNVLGSAFDFNTVKIGAIATGKAEYAKLIYSVPASGVKITARSTGLDSAVSDTFKVLEPTWYRTVKTGVWSDSSVWETSNNYGANWVPAIVAPDYNLHGQITIRNGHTVQMNGNNVTANTVDETIIEKGGVLITPTGATNRLAVNDAQGTDLMVEGKLLHNNPQSIGGVTIASPATIWVKKGGMIELASFGDAKDWAGNTNIHFEDSAFYIHNTSVANTISAGVMFPNAADTIVPIFKVGQNYTYPGAFVSTSATLAINGLLSIDSAKTFTVRGGGERLLRNGITGDGDLVIADSAKTRITANAQISGNGKILVNNAKALFQVATTSYTELKNNRELSTTANNGISVAGELNGFANGFTGNGASMIEANGTVITAHAQGLNGLFGTGAKKYNAAANYIFNGTVAQTSGNISSKAARTIVINNAAGLTLTDSVTVSDTLYMGTSPLTTSSNAVLTMAPAGVIDGYSATAFINGPLRLFADSAASVYFPIGKNTYGPVTYTAKDAATWITLEYINNNPHANSFDTTKRSEGLATIKANEYWKISSSVNVNGQVQVPYTTNTNVTPADVLNIRVVSWNGTKWVSEGPVKRTAATTQVVSDGLTNYTVFTIALDSACTIPAAPAFAPLGVCDGSDIVLNAAGNGQLRWFIAANDDMPFATGNNINQGVITMDTTYYVEAKNIGCYSNRVAYPVKFNVIPAAPAITGNMQLCYNEPARLLSDTTGITNWYADFNSTTPAFTADSITTATLTKDTSLYAENVQNGCPSPRTRVDITVRAQVQNPFSPGAEVCAGTVAVIKATANESIRWYTGNASTTPFFTGEKYTTTVLNADTTFYLEAFEGNCTSSRVAVLADVLALPAAPVLTNPSICAGNAVQLNATSTGTVYWYNDSTSSISVDSGSLFNTATLFANRKYYANVFDGKCWGPKAAASVSVFATPANVTFTLAGNVPTNQNTAIQTTIVAQNYEWNFGADATPQTAVGIGPHNVKWAAQGTKTVKLKVWNGNASVACSTEVQKTVNIGPGVGISDVEVAQAAVYPNPVNNGELNIHLGNTEKATITITDAAGRQVWNGTANTTQSTVNVDGWAAGIYFMYINTGNYNQTVKIIKQ